MRKKLFLAVLSTASIVAATTASYIIVPTTPGHTIPLAHAAAVDYFLKIEGVEGESTDDKRKGEIEIDSFSWGASQQGTNAGGGGGGAGKVSLQDFHFTKIVDKSSPILFQSVPEGKHYPSATLTVENSEGQAYMRIKMTDVLVSSFQQNGQGDRPMESLSLNYAKIEFEYMPQKPDGSLGSAVRGSWDVKANKK